MEILLLLLFLQWKSSNKIEIKGNIADLRIFQLEMLKANVYIGGIAVFHLEMYKWNGNISDLGIVQLNILKLTGIITFFVVLRLEIYNEMEI